MKYTTLTSGVDIVVRIGEGDLCRKYGSDAVEGVFNIYLGAALDPGRREKIQHEIRVALQEDRPRCR